MCDEVINAIKEKSALLNAYAEILDNLKHQERWHQHKKTVLSETGDEIETDEWEDDDSEYARNNLKAIRNVISAVRKLAGA